MKMSYIIFIFVIIAILILTINFDKLNFEHNRNIIIEKIEQQFESLINDIENFKSSYHEVIK